MSKFNPERFDDLVIKEALSEITPEELQELEDLDKLRDQYHFDREFAKTRTDAENEFIDKAIALYTSNQFECWENHLAENVKAIIDERNDR